MTHAHDRRANRRHGIAAAALALVLTAFPFPRPVTAQSFDCARAHTAEEKAICADPLLSALDEIMADFYRRLRDYTRRFDNAMGLQAQLVSEARAFLKRRARCGSDRACLERAYRGRILELLDRWQKAMDVTDEGTGADASPPATAGSATSANFPAAPPDTDDICQRLGLGQIPEMTKVCPDLKAYAKHIETWPLARNLVACALPCEAGAYNIRYRVILLDPGKPENAMFAAFDSVGPKGENRRMEEIVNPRFDPATRTLRAFDRARGLGDCGIRWIWRYTGSTFELVEQRQKTQCDGRPGPWTRIYPSAAQGRQGQRP